MHMKICGIIVCAMLVIYVVPTACATENDDLEFRIYSGRGRNIGQLGFLNPVL